MAMLMACCIMSGGMLAICACIWAICGEEEGGGGEWERVRVGRAAAAASELRPATARPVPAQRPPSTHLLRSHLGHHVLRHAALRRRQSRAGQAERGRRLASGAAEQPPRGTHTSQPLPPPSPHHLRVEHGCRSAACESWQRRQGRRRRVACGEGGRRAAAAVGARRRAASWAAAMAGWRARISRCTVAPTCEGARKGRLGPCWLEPAAVKSLWGCWGAPAAKLNDAERRCNCDDCGRSPGLVQSTLGNAAGGTFGESRQRPAPIRRIPTACTSPDSSAAAQAPLKVHGRGARHSLCRSEAPR